MKGPKGQCWLAVEGWLTILTLASCLLLTTVHGDPSRYYWSSRLSVCERPWQKVYQHDEVGRAVLGSVASLTEAVTRGDIIHVVLHNILQFQGQVTYALQADNALSLGEHVCVEALSSLNHFNRHFSQHVQGDTLWHLLLCSTGSLHVLGLLLDDQQQGSGVISDRFVNASASWFVKSWASGSSLDESCYYDKNSDGGGSGAGLSAFDGKYHEHQGVEQSQRCKSSPSPSGTVIAADYSNYLTGERAGKTRISVLLDAVRRGKDVRCVMRDRGYSFPLHLVHWGGSGAGSDGSGSDGAGSGGTGSGGTGSSGASGASGSESRNASADGSTGDSRGRTRANTWVGGHNVVHVGQSHLRTHVGIRKNPEPYMWISTWSTTGKRQNSRWTLKGWRSAGTNEDAVALDWFADPCWRHVLTNDQLGQPVEGSLDDLLVSVRRGHRVRVVVNDMAAEADVIRVRGGHVAAQLLQQLAPLGNERHNHYRFHDQARWSWQVVHTTGTVWRYEVLLSNHSLVSETRLSSRVAWFVDTRPWASVLTTANNTVQAGEVTNVARAVTAAAALRLKIHHISDNGDIFAPLVNLRIEGDNGSGWPVTSGQMIRYLGDEDSGSSEVRLQGHLTWWMTRVDTTGGMALSAWDTAREAKYFDITLFPDMEWFANY